MTPAIALMDQQGELRKALLAEMAGVPTTFYEFIRNKVDGHSLRIILQVVLDLLKRSQALA
jgi:hypothetical protein